MLELGPPGGGVVGSEITASIVGGSSAQGLTLGAGVTPDNRAQRMKLVKELTIVVGEQRLQEHGVELLWVKTKDLLESSDTEQRHDMLNFFEAMVRGQVKAINLLLYGDLFFHGGIMQVGCTFTLFLICTV